MTVDEMLRHVRERCSRFSSNEAIVEVPPGEFAELTTDPEWARLSPYPEEGGGWRIEDPRGEFSAIVVMDDFDSYGHEDDPFAVEHWAGLRKAYRERPRRRRSPAMPGGAL